MLTANVYVQVLGTGSFSTPTLVVCSDNERLLFDCGDGTQRLCVEQGLKIAKCNRIFLTSTLPEQTGGLGGFLLTRSDLSLPQETIICGPPRTGQLVKSFKHFYHRPHSLLNVFEVGCENFPTTSKDGIEVVPILIGGGQPELANATSKRTKPDLGETGRGFQLFESITHGHTTEEFTSYAVSYLLRLPERRGKFYPEKALALGITAGKNFGRLTRGESVFSPKLNRMVTKQECQDEPDERPLALVLACPSMQHLNLMMNNTELAEVLSSPIQVIFHLTNKQVFTSEQYTKWLTNTFPNHRNTQHVVVGEGLSPNTTVLPSSCRLQTRLHYVDPECFPSNEPTQVEEEDELKLAIHFNRGLPKSRFHMSPPKQVGLDLSFCHLKVVRQDEVLIAKELLMRMGNTTTPIAMLDLQENQSNTLHELIFLGTGSAMPSKYRNVTGMFLRGSKEEGGILLDCGEATLSQLGRVYGSMQLARNEIQRLLFVWISHIHADHHLGLLSILAERKGKPLIVVGPQALNYFLREYAESQSGALIRQQFYSSFVFLDCEALFKDKEMTAPALSELKLLAKLESATSVLVPHCHKSYGLVLRSTLGWSLVWSGDTEYCPELVQAGQGCDVLVHEATFEDAKADEAREKKHSTISTALRVGREMGAGTVIFTHFSQRYPKSPPPIDMDKAIVGIFAFDLMRFQPRLAQSLGAKSTQIQALFAEEEEEDDEYEE
ncbi:hypothetical protein BASA81_008424 [Batrachochytrium salamandrivorans]|nr:hypothetical protein BASA81_008424 [Batrachochytrium salamandrivorans]